jgi:hypothetical protein
MKRMRRFVGALVVAAAIAGAMPLDMARVEASGGKKGGADPQGALCGYLLSVINYPYVNEYIRQIAISAYNATGCQPALP